MAPEPTAPEDVAAEDVAVDAAAVEGVGRVDTADAAAADAPETAAAEDVADNDNNNDGDNDDNDDNDNDGGNEAEDGDNDDDGEDYNGEGGEGGEGEEAAPLDEEVYKLKSHKRARAATSAAPKEKRRSRQPKATASPEPEAASPEPDLDPKARERREIEARIDAAMERPNKRRKATGDDIERLQDDMIAQLREKMRLAAIKDAECIEQGKPALNKVKMLPKVASVLNQHSLADSILDGNLLESVRLWLEPLPDASLPSFEIQKALFSALLVLPIKTMHLRESKLGQVVLFYQKSKRPHLQIKRMADKLVGDWTRPIMGRSDNYRDKQVVTRSYDPTASPSFSPRAKSTARTPAEESAMRRNRAAIPTSRGETYSVAPMNRVVAAAAQARREQTKDGQSQFRRMKYKMLASAKSSSSTRKSKVSVEGRGLN